MAPPPGLVVRKAGSRKRYSVHCSDRDLSFPTDIALAGYAWAAYRVVSWVTGNPYPRELFTTFGAGGRQASDGVFVLQPREVEQLIDRSAPLSALVSTRKSWFQLAFKGALTGGARVPDLELIRWANEIVKRMRERAKTHAIVREDITTEDYLGYSEGTSHGEAVQIDYHESFSDYISFGEMHVYFSGTATLTRGTSDVPEILQVELRPEIYDTFDFHFTEEDEGTGFIDHAFARLQCTGLLKPFRIEGTGEPFRFTLTGLVAK